MLRSFIGLEEGTVPRKTALLNEVLVLEEDNQCVPKSPTELGRQ